MVRGYRGPRTNFEFLPKGEHVIADDDFADYLINNRHATLVEEPEAEPKPKPKRRSKKVDES